jgi:hypothetical protein
VYNTITCACGWVCVMDSLNLRVRSRKRIEDVRIPAVKGMPDDIYHMLHRTYVGILKMRRSVERADAALNASLRAAAESAELLRRVQSQGF